MHKKIRHALISGGTGGIGSSIVETFLSNEITVTCLGRCEKSFENLRRAVGSCDRLSFRTCDVTLRTEVNGVLKELSKDFGVIDALICCAGGVKTKPFHKLTDSDWHAVMNLNLHGTFNCCKSVVPHMIKNNYGRIVNIASVSGKDGNAKASAYSSSKAGVIALTKSLGKELADKNIAVNAVTPAGAKTRILDQMSKEHVQRMLSKVPRARFLELEELTSMVCWLSSAENSFSTAAVFDISGGRSTY